VWQLEREILTRINNPFAVKLYYSFQTRDNLYLVRTPPSRCRVRRVSHARLRR
jgi:hypothetical protein